jgi:hypothetical protein
LASLVHDELCAGPAAFHRADIVRMLLLHQCSASSVNYILEQLVARGLIRPTDSDGNFAVCASTLVWQSAR